MSFNPKPGLVSDLILKRYKASDAESRLSISVASLDVGFFCNDFRVAPAEFEMR